MGKKTKEYKKGQWMKRHYWPHLSIKEALAEYARLLAQQDDSCAICLRHRDLFKNNLSVDHCHKTNKVRGLLCDACNTGIGLLQDDPTILLRARDYVSKP